MAKKSEKTNALRLLDKLKIPYEAHSYPCEEFTGGEDVARQLGLDPADVCKTLVTVGKSGGHFVFVLPVTGELDRKKAAALVGEKSLEMLHVKDLLAVTGYVRGGCTALGMKKQFPTVVEQSLREKPFIYVSGGKRGLQLKLAPGDLVQAAGAMWGVVLEKDSNAPSYACVNFFFKTFLKMFARCGAELHDLDLTAQP